jgi:hypothetical protein
MDVARRPLNRKTPPGGSRYSDTAANFLCWARSWPEVGLGEALQSGDGGVIVISSKAVYSPSPLQVRQHLTVY